MKNVCVKIQILKTDFLHISKKFNKALTKSKKLIKLLNNNQSA